MQGCVPLVLIGHDVQAKQETSQHLFQEEGQGWGQPHLCCRYKIAHLDSKFVTF